MAEIIEFSPGIQRGYGVNENSGFGYWGEDYVNESQRDTIDSQVTDAADKMGRAIFGAGVPLLKKDFSVQWCGVKQFGQMFDNAQNIYFINAPTSVSSRDGGGLAYIGTLGKSMLFVLRYHIDINSRNRYQFILRVTPNTDGTATIKAWQCPGISASDVGGTAPTLSGWPVGTLPRYSPGDKAAMDQWDDLITNQAKDLGRGLFGDTQFALVPKEIMWDDPSGGGWRDPIEALMGRPYRGPGPNGRDAGGIIRLMRVGYYAAFTDLYLLRYRLRDDNPTRLSILLKVQTQPGGTGRVLLTPYSISAPSVAPTLIFLPGAPHATYQTVLDAGKTGLLWGC